MHFFFPIPFIIFALLFSLPPSRNSDPGSHSRLFSPLPTTVPALRFLREKISALPFFFFQLFFQLFFVLCT